MKTLDILMPHYRDPEGLQMSLDSIAAQSWDGAMRVVVIDDGSPAVEAAEAEAICAAFAQDHGIGMAFAVNPQNLGRPRTRNRLLEAVEADHVAWLDAGDIWYPDKLALQFEHLSRMAHRGVDPDLVWVSCGYDWSQIATGKLRTLRQRPQGDQVVALLEGTQLRAYLWTLLGTAQAFSIAGRFDERLPRLQDLDYFLRFVRAGGKIAVPPGPQPLCRYFKSDIGRNASEIHACYRIILDKNRPVIQARPRSFSSKLHYKANRLAARFAASNGDRLAAAGYLGRAVLGSPLHSARVARVVLTRRLRGERA